MDFDISYFINSVILLGLSLFLAKKLRFSILELLVLCCFVIVTPLLFNDLLFSPSYMSDQFRYLDCVLSIRQTLTCDDRSQSVIVASYIYSLTPLIINENLANLALANKFLILVFYVYWSVVRKACTYKSLFIYMMFPSFVLYSSVALRDVVIFLCLSSIYLTLLDKQYILYATLVLLIAFLKPYYLSLVILISVVRVLNLKQMILASFFVVIAIILYEQDILRLLNNLHFKFYLENSFSTYSFQAYTWVELCLLGIGRFFIVPVDQLFLNFYYLLYSLDSLLFLFVFLGSLVVLIDSKRFLIVVGIVLLGSLVAFIVSNEGTMLRYIFSIKMFLIFIFLNNIRYSFNINGIRNDKRT